MIRLIILIALAIGFLIKDYRKNGEISFGALLVILFVALISLPGIKRNLEEKVAEIDISSKNIYSLNLKEDLENIKKEFNIKDDVGLYWFEMDFSHDGEISYVSYDLIQMNNKKKFSYYVYYDKDKTNGKYLIKRYKEKNYEELLYKDREDVNRIFEKIEFIKGERPINKYDEYRISVIGETKYRSQNDRSIFVDKNNNMKELTSEDSQVEGLFIILEGIKKDGSYVNTSAAAHGSLGSINFIFE